MGNIDALLFLCFFMEAIFVIFSYSYLLLADLYSLTILISLTSLTTLAALEPVLEAFPAWANYAADLAEEFPLKKIDWIIYTLDLQLH